MGQKNWNICISGNMLIKNVTSLIKKIEALSP